MGSKRIGLARVESLLENLKRDINMNGSHLKAATGYSSTLTTMDAATEAVTQANDGSTLEFHRAAGVTATLPAAVIGTKYNFVVRTLASSNALVINCSSGDSFSTNSWVVEKDRTEADVANRLKRPSSGNNTLTMTHHAANKTGLLGTHFTIVCVAANTWKVTGEHYFDATGALTFTTA